VVEKVPAQVWQKNHPTRFPNLQLDPKNQSQIFTLIPFEPILQNP